MEKVKFKIIKEKSIWWDIAFAVGWLAVLAFLIWKAPKGFGNCDESFYLVTPLRLIQGDALLFDEWHLSQMSAVLIAPFLYIYLQIAGSTTGIILAFRFIYVGLMAIVSLFLYMRLRGKSQPGAGAAAFSIFIYAPFGISAMSYNSLGIVTLVIAAVIMYTAKRAVRLQQAAAGFFFAAAVLCCPYLLGVYAVYTLTMAGMTIFRKQKNTYKVFKPKSWLFFTIGAAIAAFLFAMFVLSRASVREVMSAIPYMLADPDHASRTLFQLITTFAVEIVTTVPFTRWIYAGLGVLLAVTLADRDRKERRALYLAIALAGVIGILVLTRFFRPYINFFQFPVCVMGIFCFILVKTEDIRSIFYYIWIPGILYSFCIHISSNQLFYAISSASSVALAGSLMMCILGVKEIFQTEFSMGEDKGMVKRSVAHITPGPETFKVEMETVEERVFVPGEKRHRMVRLITVILALVLCLGQLGLQLFSRYESVFWESLQSLELTEITEGPEKGLHASKANVLIYEDSLKLAEHIRKQYPDAENAAFVSARTWMYLVMNELRNSAQSGWIPGIIDGRPKVARDSQMAYYEMNPAKLPDIMYFDKELAPFAADFKKKFEEMPETECAVEKLESGAVILSRTEKIVDWKEK